MEEQLTKAHKLLELYKSTNEKLMKTGKTDNETYTRCISTTNELIKYFDSLNFLQLYKQGTVIKKVYLASAELYIRTIGLNFERTEPLDQNAKGILGVAVSHLNKSLQIDPEYTEAINLIKHVMLFIAAFSPQEESLEIVKQLLIIDPCDPNVHFNIANCYARKNDLNPAVIHFKTACGLSGNNELFKSRCYTGLGSLYFTLQNRDIALFYLNKAWKITPEDPDINNQLGVVYTELRIISKAIFHYNKALKEAVKSGGILAASISMNKGLAECYRCEFEKAIECYNTALRYKPDLSLAYQNKLLDMHYILHQMEDPSYLTKCHFAISKIYPKVVTDYRVSLPDYKPKEKGDILNIGFVSGDFICHPVSYFISGILRGLNRKKFRVYCYYTRIHEIGNVYPECNFKSIKGMSPEKLFDTIKYDAIDILFDLSVHTGENRLDTFVLKPAPIQISYCGYPDTAGVKSMDYHFTDEISNNPKHAQKHYVEKLVCLKNCFLNYNPGISLHELPLEQNKNEKIVFGSFNRLNKVNSLVISVYSKLLNEVDCKLLIKTKEFQTKEIKEKFLSNFTKEQIEKIIIVDYTDSYKDHLLVYNQVDILLDTFPYSGTTTSCEALLMGVPVLTIFDNVNYIHVQNVTTSLLKNSGLDEYITYSTAEFIEKAKGLSRPDKNKVRNKFVNGHVMNTKEFLGNFEETLENVYFNHAPFKN